MLDHVLSYWREQSDKFLCKQIYVAAECPLIEYEKAITISSPFDIFEFGMDILAYIPPVWSKIGIEELNNSINQSIQENEELEVNIHCHIFDEPIEEIRGYLTAEKDECLYVLMFGQSESNEENEDFLYL